MTTTMPKHLSNRSGWMTKNILNTYRQANTVAHQYGDEWYRSAHTFGVGLSEKYDITVWQAVGIIAALSPSCGWDRNMILAEDLIQTGDCNHMYGDAIKKARAILAGENPADVLGGDKVRSFFHNILHHETSEAVTVDRHAFDIAVNQVTDDTARKALARGGRKIADAIGEFTTGNYQVMANAYRSAANILGVKPHQVQAVTWCAWREAKGIV